MKKISKKIVILLIIFCVALSVTTIIFAQKLSNDNNLSLEIYFYPLNVPDSNSASIGDSCIIKIGDVEILIDAGATQKSASIITQKMKECVSSDKVWDYIFATHADSDHISAFSCDNGVFSLFNQIPEKIDKDKWTLKTLIDFDVTKDETVKYKGKNELFVSSTYKKYSTERDLVVDACNSNYYSASQCCWQQRGLEFNDNLFPKSNVFSLPGGAKLTVLYNYYYDHRFNEENKIASLDRNLLSVCLLIEYGEGQRFLFTGDLPEYDSQSITGEDGNYSVKVLGETKLIENNPILKKGVSFYKAGHHGSRTSSSEKFIDTIHPAYVVIPTIADSLEHHTSDSNDIFPATKVLERILKYTDYIYIPEIAVNKMVKDALGEEKLATVGTNKYHGNITIHSNGKDIWVDCENYKNINFQKTPWFLANRNSVFNTFVFTVKDDILGVGHCTLIKYGHIDILIDCGVNGINQYSTNSRSFFERLEQYCVDGVIEYLIVTSAQTESISQLISQYKYNESLHDGIFDKFKIENLYDFGEKTNITSASSGEKSSSWLSRYYEERNNLVSSDKIKHYNEYNTKGNSTKINIDDNFYLELFNAPCKKSYRDEDNYSICTLVNFYGEKLFFAGDLTNQEDAESILIQEKNKLSNISFYLAAAGGIENSNSDSLLTLLNPEYVVLDSPAGMYLNGKEYPSISTCIRILKNIEAGFDGVKKVYLTCQYENGLMKSITGDINFNIKIRNGSIIRKSLVGSNSTIIIEKTDWFKKQINKY